MKATHIIYLALAVSACAYCGEDAAARLARTRELVARHAASSVQPMRFFGAQDVCTKFSRRPDFSAKARAAGTSRSSGIFRFSRCT